MTNVKRVQNKVAESVYTLPVVALCSIGIWLMVGLLHRQLWVQFGCFVLTVFMILTINKANALIRIYSRSVAVSFIVLSCTACFMFPSLYEGICELCLTFSLLVLFMTYDDKQSPGITFYGFLLLGIASLFLIRVLWYIPYFWLLMGFFVYSFSWRTFLASILGLICPYWFAAAWVLWHEEGNFGPLGIHLRQIADIQPTFFDISLLSLPQQLSFAFLTLLLLMGTIHFLRKQIDDKIRVRQIYYSFIFLGIFSILFLLLQPQHYELPLRMLIIAVSPLIAHFITLTHTRLTNIAFCVIAASALILTALNLWML